VLLTVGASFMLFACPVTVSVLFISRFHSLLLHFLIIDHAGLEEQTTHVHGSKEASLKSGSNLACNTRDGINDHSCTLNLHSAGQSTLLEVDEYSELGNLSSEVSAIYLAMQQSKLECIDEQSQDSTSTEGYGEAEETEEYDDFDPYSFIKDLPDLSMVVPKFRPVLLPKQTRSCPTMTLVLDLDGMNYWLYTHLTVFNTAFNSLLYSFLQDCIQSCLFMLFCCSKLQNVCCL
jgi:CTD small phosphatase-like protein 2